MLSLNVPRLLQIKFIPKILHFCIIFALFLLVGTRHLQAQNDNRPGSLFAYDRKINGFLSVNADYPVTIHLTALQDFTGTIVDSVPLGYEIKPPQNSLPFDEVLIQTSSQKIHWTLTLKKGQTATLGYYLNIKDSPSAFYLGPLNIFNQKEKRLFQETKLIKVNVSSPTDLGQSSQNQINSSENPQSTVAISDFRRQIPKKYESENPVTFYLTANEDFTGTLEETLKPNLTIVPPRRSQKYNRIIETANSKKIYWNISLKKGEAARFGYIFLLDSQLENPTIDYGPLLVSTDSNLVFKEEDNPSLHVNHPPSSQKSLIDTAVSPIIDKITGFLKPPRAQLAKQVFNQDENISINIANIDPDRLEVVLETENQSIAVEKEIQEGKIIIKKPYHFRPGKYHLKLTDASGQFSYQQDFTWGVLAINTDKSIYLPDQTASISLAVLDDNGAMVCDSELELKITSPDGKETSLSTKDSSITVNPECKIHNFTEKPDYQTSYQVSSVGKYIMSLTSKTTKGEYQISDQFEVRSSVDFDLSRTSATRIYPASSYPVRIKIIANQDFTGTIEEPLPSSFKVSPLDNTLSFSSLTPGVETQTISWDVNLKKGDILELGYAYDAPDTSPEFYLLGPLRFVALDGNQIFQEGRNWQIASDAVARMILFWSGTQAQIPSGWSCVSCGTGDPFYRRFIRGAPAYSALAGGTETHTHSNPGTLTTGAVNVGTTIRASASTSTTSAPQSNHTHTFTVTSGLSGNNLPAYIDLLVMQYDAGIPQIIPAGAIGLFDSSPPAGWSSVYANNEYIRGSGTTQTTVQSANTHTHTIVTSITSIASIGTTTRSHASSTRYVAGVGHSHPSVSAASTSATNEPPRFGSVLGRSASDIALPSGLIAMFNNQPPSGQWSLLSDTTGKPYYNRFAKITGTYNSESSDVDTHSHTVTVTTGVVTIPNTRLGTTNTYPFGTTTHTHTTTVNLASVASQLPPYSDVIIAKASSSPAPNLQQSHFHWRNDNGTEITASSETSGSEDTNPVSSDGSINHRLRVEISNEGGTAYSGAQLRLEYGAKSTTCAAISTWIDVGASSGDWDMYDSSNITHGSNTTNLTVGMSGGVTDANPTFLTPNSALLDTSSSTSALTLTYEDFVELEYSIKAAASASGNYCFRVTNLGSVTNFSYSVYPEATVPSAATINIGGICRESDLSTNCSDVGTIRVAYDNQLQATSQPTVAGSWEVSNIIAPTSGQIVTVYIQGADDNREAVAVTKYDGDGSISGLKLIQSVLSLGSSDTQTLSNQDLNQYDYTSSGNNEDIFYEVNSGSLSLNTCAPSSGTCSTNGLFVNSAFRPSSSTPVDITTHNFYPQGVLTMDSNNFYVSGDWIHQDSGSYSADTSSVYLNGPGYSTQKLVGSFTFYNLTITTSQSRTFEIQSSHSIYITHNVNLSGADCNNLLLLRSSVSGTQFQYFSGGSGTVTRQFLDVQDMEGYNGTISFTNTVDSGNNTNTSFGSNSCLGASSNFSATASSSQRKTFYDNTNSVYWQLFHDGSEIEVKYSANTTAWNNANRLTYNTNDFSVWNQNIGSTEYIFITLTSGYDIFLRRGVLSSNSITWDSNISTPLNGSLSSDNYSLPSVSLDSSGYIWVSARYYNGSSYSPVSTRSNQVGNTNLSTLTWGQPQSLAQPVGDPNVYSSIAPLSGQNMYSAFVSGGSLLGCFWNNSSNQWQNTQGSSCSQSSLVPEPYSISSSSSLNATGSNHQRKNWFDGSRYWSAFNSNDRIEFWYSSNGVNWSENLSSRLSVNSSDFSISAGSSNAYIVYSDSGSVSVRQASSYPSSSFTWGGANSVYQNGTHTAITQDTNQQLWLSLTHETNIDPIFSDGFELNNFNAWDNVTNNGVGTTVEVLSSAAYSGNYGVHQSVISNQNGWGNVTHDISFGSGDVLYATYRFRRNSITGNGYAGYATFFNFPSYVRILGHINYLGVDYAVVRKLDGTSQNIAFNTNLSDDQWYQMTLVIDYSGSNPYYQILVNGQEQASYTDTSSGTPLYPDNFIAGAQELSWSLSTDVNYDDIALYDQDPSPADSDKKVVAIGSSSPNSPAAWVTPAILKTSNSSSVYSLIVPRSSGSVTTLWQDGDSLQSNSFVGTTWASSPTSIATGSTRTPNTISAVGDTASGALHLAYIDPSGSLKYTKNITSWGTAVTLDTGTSNHDPAISIDTSNNGNLSLFWINHQSVNQKNSASPYNSNNWDTNSTLIYSGGSNQSLSSSYYSLTKPILSWTTGSANPYQVYSYINSGTWYSLDWSTRQKITLNNSQIGGTGTLTDYVMLVSSTNPEWKDVAHGGQVAQADGGDFVFVSGIGNTKLDHEIEKYDPVTGQLIVWVKIPLISKDNENRLYLYYGNSDCSNQWDTTGSLWPSSYQAVWHLNQEQSGVGNTDLYRDSSGNNYHADDHVTSVSKPELIGSAQGFSSANSDYLTAGVISSLSGVGTITVSGWLKRNAANGFSGYIGEQNVAGNGVGIILYTDGNLYFGVSNGSTIYGNTPLNDTNWHHVTMVFDGSGATNADRLKGYVDGVQATLNFYGTVPTQTPSDSIPFEIGRQGFNGTYTNGSIDEVRVNNTPLVGSQILTEYNNQSSPGTFYTIASAATAPSGTNQDIIDSSVINSSSVFSLTSNFSDTIQISYLDDEATDRISYKSLSIGNTWLINPVQIESSNTIASPSLSIDSATGDPYSFWVDTSNNYVYYRSCDASASSSQCNIGGDWSAETVFHDSGFNHHLNTSFAAPFLVLAQMSVGSSAPVTLFWDRLAISPSSNQAPLSPQIPHVNNNSASTGQTTPVFGLTDHTPAFSAIFSDNDSSDTAIYYQLQVNTSSDFSGTSLWDSTKTSLSSCNQGSRCQDLVYNGSTLNSSTNYYWRIKYWDNSNAEGPWSATQQFTINSPPSVTNLVLNGGDNINLIENSSVGISWSATIIDTDGHDNLLSYTGKMFRSGVGSSQACDANNNNCYQASNCTPSNCSGNSCLVTCMANIYFIADPTDAGSTYSAQHWQAWMEATDDSLEVGSTLSPAGSPDVVSMSGLDVSNQLVFGVLLPGDDTGSSNPVVVLTNTGNRVINADIKGDNLCPNYPDCEEMPQIPVDYQQFALSTFIYGVGNTLNGSYQTVNIGLSKPTLVPSNSSRNIYFGIAIPENKETGSYSGRVEIFAFPR